MTKLVRIGSNSMSFSGINVEQRSKEVEALKSFLAYSILGSLVLHIGVLSSGISNYLTRMPEENDLQIEVAIVDSPTREPEKPLEEIPQEPKKEPEIVQKQPIETPPAEKVQQQFEQITAVAQKPQPINTRPITPQVPVKPAPIARTAAPTAASEDSKTSSAGGGGGGGSGVGLGSGSGIAVGTSSGTGPGGGTGTGTGGGIGSGTGTGTGSGIGSGTGSGIGSGTGSGIGSGTGNGIGNEPVNRPVATAPTAPTPPKINTSGNSNGRAACRKCDFKYPESFKRRGIEGRTGLAFDTDEQGNVINVRVASSSGNRELDEEHLRQAREWKFNPAQGGRRGVRVNSAAFKENSRQYRQYQQQRKKETEQRTQQATASNSNTTEGTSRRRRREFTSSPNQATTTRTAESRLNRPLRRQRVETTATSSQGTARESLRRVRSERATTNSSQQPQATINRRRRRTNANQNKLRESLRRLRQPQAQPATPSQQ
ncbi:MAG: TonB family protein [Nostoc sp. ChiSLP02]|nr:TonB family protein [Nostoc sp. DedSLP05]MDZ8102781.1 TonB family protein [Nostoc sp. DedSLP01]MDZ8184209.1 TonB family protein [Nostoc sp. ChiSLP02]